MDPNSLLFLTALSMMVASPSPSADLVLMNAYLKQSGIERNIEAHAKRLERRYVSKDVKVVTGYAAYLGKVLVEKRITIQWGF